MSDVIKIRMVHVRQVSMCSKGARDFFKKHDLDWDMFLNEGLDSNLIEATGDAMALAVVEAARNGR